MKPEFLFHGSSIYIKGFLTPRLATDKQKLDNSQNAVYATNNRDAALAMSLFDKGKNMCGTMSYNQKKTKITLSKEPDKNTPRFLYKVSSQTFSERPKNSGQWLSYKKVQIVETTIFKTQDLENLYEVDLELCNKIQKR